VGEDGTAGGGGVSGDGQAMKRGHAMLLMLCALCIAGCVNLDDYRRSYTVTYEDRLGQRVSVGMTLEKRQAAELVAAMARREAPVEPLGPVVGVQVDPEPVPMQEAAVALAVLTDEGRERSTVRPVMWAPPSPADTMFYLTKGGKLRLETDVDTARAYRAAGWMDAPLPMWDPEVHHAPVWRGRWVVPRAKQSTKQ
jgi:hypothetical protein